MASIEITQADGTAPASQVLRVFVYLVATVAFAAAVWALIRGGDRDLWGDGARPLTSMFVLWFDQPV